MADFFHTNKMEYNPVVFEKVEEANAALEFRRCDAYVSQSGLYAIRLTLANPEDHVILHRNHLREPLGGCASG